MAQGGPGQALPNPPAPPPPLPTLPGLLPLSRAQVAQVLGRGTGCMLSDGGRTLMVASLSGAFANDGGMIVRLKPDAKDWEALLAGGRFIADRLRIEVDPGGLVAGGEGMVERDSSVFIVRGRRVFGVSHGPRWACRG